MPVLTRDLPIVTGGTITVTSGSKTVTCTGNVWQNISGDEAENVIGSGCNLVIDSGAVEGIGLVDALVSNGELTLAIPWPYATYTGTAYKIFLPTQSASPQIKETLNQILRRVGAILTFATTATAALATIPSGVDVVRIAAGDVPYLRTASAPPHTGFFQDTTGAYFEHAGEWVRSSLFSTPSVAAAIAWARRVPLFHDSDGDAILDFDSRVGASTDVERGQKWDEVLKWQGRCFITNRIYVTPVSPAVGGARNEPCIIIRMEDGLHRCFGAYSRGQGVIPLHVRSRGTNFRKATAVTVVNHTADHLYELKLDLDVALEASYEPGMAFGIRNARGATLGDAGAEALNGAFRIKSIAVDRLSVNFDFRYARANDWDAPTTISNKTIATLIAEYPVPADRPIEIKNEITRGADRFQCTFPRSTVGATGGWGGGNLESFLSMYFGGWFESQNMGWSDLRGADAPYSIIGCFGTGSFVRFRDYDCGAGGSDRFLRQFGGGSIYLNRGCFGGDQLTGEALSMQANGMCFATRCNFNGGFTRCIIVGSGVATSITQCYVSNAVNIITTSGELTGEGDTATGSCNIQATRFVHGTRGVYSVAGSFYGEANTEVAHCDTGLAWLSGGTVKGPITCSNNVSDATDEPNVLEQGGGWYKDLLIGLRDPGELISIEDEFTWETEITGVGGKLGIYCEGDNDKSAELLVRLQSPNAVINAIYAGSEVVIATGAIVAPVNPGKITVTVRDDSGVFKLRIVNEGPSTARLRVYSWGRLFVNHLAVQIDPVPPPP